MHISSESLRPPPLAPLPRALRSRHVQVSEAYKNNRELLRDMRLQLLDLLSLAIAKRPFSPSTTQSKFQALNSALASGQSR